MSLVCPSLLADIYPGACRAVDIYCERTSAALDAEPINALTNIAFLIAAGCAWRLQSRRGDRIAAGPVRALIACIALVGLGSFLFHTVATRWAEWGDVIPILIFMLLFLWLVLTRVFGWAVRTTIFAVSLFAATTFLLEAAVPEVILWGGALYLPALLTLIAAAAALYRRDVVAGRAMFAATGIFLASFAARTLDVPICAVFPLGTHFLWHILNAVLTYWLVRVVILYAPARQPGSS